MRRLFVYVPALGGRLVEWEILRDRLAQEPECANDDFQHWPAQPRDHVGAWTRGELTWMRYLAEHPERQPEVVQLLGTNDVLVEREDSRDVEQFPRASHVSIAGAAHLTVLDLSAPTGRDRYEVLKAHIPRPPQRRHRRRNLTPPTSRSSCTASGPAPTAG